jgi:SAM-dependent methyltransferase
MHWVSSSQRGICPGPLLNGEARTRIRFPRIARLGSVERSESTELLEDPRLPDHIVARAYRDLDRTHRWLGNTAEILRLLQHGPFPVRSVLDIGCGHGALLGHVRRRLGVDVVGFDLRPAPPSALVPILTGNAIVDPLPRADVAVAVCMVHHLSEADFIRLVHNVARSCRRFIVLDLVRHHLPLVLFRTFLAPFLYRLNVVDGMTSLRRSYTPVEMRRVVGAALQDTGGRVRHTVAPFYIRQVADISW